MSTTSNAQNLLVNVFRPTYTYDSINGYVAKLVISNVDTISTNNVVTGNLNVTDSRNNVYVGCNAGNSFAVADTKGSSNLTALGYGAGSNNSNSSNSIYIGYNSAALISNSSAEVIVGANTIGGGTSNVYLGPNSGSVGSSNIFLGSGITPGTVSNSLRIGNTSNILLAGIINSNYVGINNVAPVASLDVSGDTYFRNKVGIQMLNPSKSLEVNGQTYSTGGFIAGNGTVSAPAYSFFSDSSSGIFRPGTNRIGFVTSAVERMSIVGASVGIGTTSPVWNLDVAGTIQARVTGIIGPVTVDDLSANLHVKSRPPVSGEAPCVIALQPNHATSARGIAQIRAIQDGIFGPATALGFYTREDSGSDFNPNSLITERMRISGRGGNVGIGLTAPTEKLHVAGTIRTDTSLLVVPNATYLARYSSNDSIYALNNVHTDAGYFMGVSESQYLASGSQAPLVTSSTLAGLHVIRENSAVTGLIFKTNSTGAFERMRITGAGLVGIGTSAPTTALDVAGTTTTTSLITNNLSTTIQSDSSAITYINMGTAVSSALNTQFLFCRGGGSAPERYSGISYASFGTNNFYTYASGGLLVTKFASTVLTQKSQLDVCGSILTLSNNGNVGIGTLAPAYRLDISASAAGVASVNMTTWPRTQASNVLFRKAAARGATNTNVLTFSTNLQTMDTALVDYTSNATNGDSFTIKKNGFYTISTRVFYSTAAWILGITYGSGTYTSSPFGSNMTTNTIIASSYSTVGMNCSYTGYFQSNTGIYRIQVSPVDIASASNTEATLNIVFHGESASTAAWPT